MSAAFPEQDCFYLAGTGKLLKLLCRWMEQLDSNNFIAPLTSNFVLFHVKHPFTEIRFVASGVHLEHAWL